MYTRENQIVSTQMGGVWMVVGLLLVLLVLGGCAAQPSGAGAALPAEISVDQAAQKRSQGAYILDVRERSEWDQFHIPGPR